MSELTPCNYCSWRRMRRLNPDLRLRPAPREHWPDAVEVVDENGEFKAWFAELPDHCVC